MMTELTLSQMAQAYGGTLMYPDCHFQSVSTDSRHIDEGQLFVALRGDRFDAHEFLPEVATRVSGMVVERPAKDINVPQWVVSDTTEALGHIAQMNRESFVGPVVAITGSSGKTTVKEMVATILGESGPVLATKGNLNNHIGVPLTLLGLSDRHRFAVIEMGASAIGEIGYLCGLARPDVVLVNNILPAHVAGFGSIENIAKAKGEIYQGVSVEGVAIINVDEGYAKQWRASTGARVLTFSMVDPQADFTAKSPVVGESGCYEFVLVTPAGEAAIRLGLRGEHNVANALAAAACAYAAGAELGVIAAGLNKLQQVPGRLNLEILSSGATLIDDSYNANPGSVKAAINTLMNFNGRRILVLGDMGELGDDETHLHADVGRYAADKGVDFLLAVGPLCLNAVQEFGANGKHFDSKEQLSEYLVGEVRMQSDAVVLVKGSRFMAMEDVVRLIKESGEQ
ncbi:MAG: UDP-N-acetylmuramoyl-tripeptide--D-alanyl-D-alanine ligase [Porticoccus sp.]|nr:UDP-N-acetylmuramoyl-tripeptide--D-alanyl-D-alanine ligase [Porticoccus sp.]